MMDERPRLDRPPVQLPALPGPLSGVWDGLAALADAAGDLPWTVVGGQMVLLHGLEGGHTPHRVSTDIDCAIDVRANPRGVRRLVEILVGLGFDAAGTSPEGRTYRFARPLSNGDAAIIDVMLDGDAETGGPDEELVVDVLVPEGLGERADITTVGRGTAFPAPGVSQALKRTELVPIAVGDGVSWVPRPNLLGAIVGKATAADVDDQDVERHYSDIVFLAGLVTDPIKMRANLTRKDRQRLSRLVVMLPESHPIWSTSSDAFATIDLLLAPEA